MSEPSPSTATLPASRGVGVTKAPAPRIRGVGLLTGWGEGLVALEAAERRGATGLVTVPTPALEAERFRRATRECLLGIAAVRAALREAGLGERDVGGDRTGILYVSATAYAAAIRGFLEEKGATTLHFPYTAPSAVPGEVTIEFGLRGPYVNLMGGGPAALEGLGYAAHWLTTGAADRVLVLAVETVHEVWDLLARVPWLRGRSVVEGAACVLLEPGSGDALAWSSTRTSRAGVGSAVSAVLAAVLEARMPAVLGCCSSEAGFRRSEALALARYRAAVPLPVGALGESFACGPLIGLAQARAVGQACLLTASWRAQYAAMRWPIPAGGAGGAG